MKFNRNRLMISFILITLFLVFLSAFTRFVFFKDFTFLVEGPCDPEKSTCFIRSCDEYCPPNALENYAVYNLNASEFSKCTDNSCSNMCTPDKSSDSCEEVKCDPSANDNCSEDSKSYEHT